MAAPKRNSESAKLDYEPTWQRDAEEVNQNRDRVEVTYNPSRDGVGHEQEDPWRHLDDPYVPQYPSGKYTPKYYGNEKGALSGAPLVLSRGRCCG